MDTSTQPLASGLRYRGTRLLQMFNGLPVPHEEILESSYPLTTLPNPAALPSGPSERLFINITVNRVCRLLSILGFGFWGGWSCLPDEKRAPTSVTWVIFVVVLTDWIAVTAVVDCLWPTAMKWYFRTPLPAKCLYTSAENNGPPRVKISLYRVANTIVALGYLVARVVKRHDDDFISTIQFIAGGFGIFSLWANWVESDDKGMRMKWLFQDNRDAIFLVITFPFAAVTWWWIAYRITAIAIILRRRNDEEMRLQFLILMFGLIVEGSALCTFLALPIIRRVFKNLPLDDKLWYSHLISSIAMLVFWVMVLIVGFGEKLVYVLYPCTDSQSFVCSILISYLG